MGTSRVCVLAFSLFTTSYTLQQGSFQAQSRYVKLDARLCCCLRTAHAGRGGQDPTGEVSSVLALILHFVYNVLEASLFQSPHVT